MGVFQAPENFEKVFSQLSTPPIIVNDYLEVSEEDRDAMNRLLYTNYTSDLLDNIPTCGCGKIIGEMNIGVICHECGKEVRSIVDEDIEALLWMRAPDGVAALINPTFWIMMSKYFTVSGFNIIQWITDTSYKPSVKTPPIMDAVIQAGIQRGLNNFVENFDEIIGKLFDLKKKKNETPTLQTMIAMYRDCIFTSHLPLPNKSLLVVESNNMGTYVDPIVIGAIDAIRNMVGIDSELACVSTRTKENRTVRSLVQLSGYIDEFTRTSSGFAKKKGVFRKHVYGSRLHWTFRAVISSLTDVHKYDEIHISWGIGVSVFRTHLANKLFKRGFTANQIAGFLNEYAQKYHPLLDELFKELIAEAPGRGISCIMQRNPSLKRASAQHVYIVKVNTDVEVPTVFMSILAVRGLNADYDGKQNCCQ